MTGLNFNPIFNNNPYYDSNWTPNQMGYGYPNSIDSWFSNTNTSVGDTFVSSGDACDDYARLAKKNLPNKLKAEEEAKALANATANEAKMKQVKEELERNGLGLTDEQKKHFMSAVEKMLEAQNPSFKDDMMMYTTMPLVTAVGLHPIQNITTSLWGENSRVFNQYKDLYKTNNKLMTSAKSALRDAERFSQRKSRGFTSKVFKNMKKDMASALDELSKAEANLAKATGTNKGKLQKAVEQARQNVKNITEAINNSNAQTSGFLTKLKNRTGVGKPTAVTRRTYETAKKAAKRAAEEAAKKTAAAVAQTTTQTGAAAVQNVTNTAGVMSKAGSYAIKGLKVAGKGICKFAKKGLLIAAFEVYNDKDRLKKAWGKDTITGLKQTGQTAVKATCVTAGVLVGMKAGAAIGTCIGGPIGTAVGFVAGAVIGGIGALLGRKVAKTVVRQDVADEIKTEEANKPSEKQLEVFQEVMTWSAQNQDKLSQEEMAVLNQIYSGLNPEQQPAQ